jgi:WhiB family transcriptional regulator, redox-sensing transcriptional regulator
LGDWYRDAACRGHDVELFYSEEREDVLRALRICGGCPVRDACREQAMAEREFFGVWGGMPGQYRRRLFRRADRQRRREERAA